VTGDDDPGLELVEAAAVADGFGADAVRVGGAVCAVAARIEEVTINRVIGLGISEPATGAALDRIADVYGSIRHAIALAPGARAAGLAAMLRERGYEPAHAWIKFARAAADPPAPATDLRIERIGPERADEFTAVLAAGFQIPQTVTAMLSHLPGRRGWSWYLAQDGDEPVACGALFVHGRHGWLGQAATLPAHRRRGAQSALIAARIRAAAEAGAEVVVTETGEIVDDRPTISYHNILRAGFRAVYLRPNYVSPPADAAA
jgi:GNAT superfamily N-acetyltransferase